MISLRTMTLPPALNTRSLKRIISLLLYFQKLIRNYQISETMSALYISIKLLHNDISIPMGFFRPEIPILIRIFYSKIPILMGLFHFGIPILMELSLILNKLNAELFKANGTNNRDAGFIFLLCQVESACFEWTNWAFFLVTIYCV